MSALAIGFTLAALGGLALAGGGRRRVSRDTCSATPETASRWARSRLREWVDCTTRTAADVEALATRLTTRGRRADAEHVRARWRARRAVEDAPPDGRLHAQEGRAAATAVESPTPPAAVPSAPPGHATSGSQTTRAPASTATTTTTTAAPAASSTSTGSRGRGAGTRPEVGPGEGARDPDEARRLVSRLVPRLRERRNYHNLLSDFQYAAGIRSDGIYGGLSENAIRYYGGDPPRAFRPPTADAPEANYVDRIIAPPSGDDAAAEPVATRPSVSQGERRAGTGATTVAHEAEVDMASGAATCGAPGGPPASDGHTHPFVALVTGETGPPRVGGMTGAPEAIPAGVADKSIVGGASDPNAPIFGGAAADSQVPSMNGG